MFSNYEEGVIAVVGGGPVTAGIKIYWSVLGWFVTTTNTREVTGDICSGRVVHCSYALLPGINIHIISSSLHDLICRPQWQQQPHCSHCSVSIVNTLAVHCNCAPQRWCWCWRRAGRKCENILSKIINSAPATSLHSAAATRRPAAVSVSVVRVLRRLGCVTVRQYGGVVGGINAEIMVIWRDVGGDSHVRAGHWSSLMRSHRYRPLVMRIFSKFYRIKFNVALFK